MSLGGEHGLFVWLIGVGASNCSRCLVLQLASILSGIYSFRSFSKISSARAKSFGTKDLPISMPSRQEAMYLFNWVRSGVTLRKMIWRRAVVARIATS